MKVYIIERFFDIEDTYLVCACANEELAQKKVKRLKEQEIEKNGFTFWDYHIRLMEVEEE